jgi:hypothetical protein
MASHLVDMRADERVDKRADKRVWQRAALLADQKVD